MVCISFRFIIDAVMITAHCDDLVMSRLTIFEICGGGDRVTVSVQNQEPEKSLIKISQADKKLTWTKVRTGL